MLSSSCSSRPRKVTRAVSWPCNVHQGLKQTLTLQGVALHRLYLCPCAAFHAMMTAGLLNPEYEAVRGNTYKFGERLALSSSGQGHMHLLEMLSHLQTADLFPHHCSEYYRLLTDTVHTIPAMAPQVMFSFWVHFQGL